MSLPDGLNHLIQNNVPLCRFSTFQIGGPARYFAQPAEREGLLALLAFQREESIPCLVIGRGSNILFPDEGFSGLVISLQKYEIDRVCFNPDGVVRASAGVSLFRLSAACQEQGLSGLEFVCHIPGTVGGAVWMNSGFGRPERPYREIKDVLQSISAIDCEGNFQTLRREEIKFEYRESHLEGFLILDALFRTTPAASEDVREEVRANFVYRNSVQDLRYPSAGSIFKNPKKGTRFSSGQLIDKAGLKGFRVGGAMISEKHGNFILNVGQATARDVRALIHLAKTRVREMFGVELEPEVKLISPANESEAIEAGMLV